MRMFRRQHVREEPISERRVRVEVPRHLRLLDDDDRGGSHGRRRRHPVRLSGETALAEKVVVVQYRNDRLFSGMGQH